MKTFRFGIIISSILSVTSFSILPAQHIPNDAHGFPTPTEGTPDNFTFTCPMHPEVILESPGTCYKCGMDLNKQETKNKSGEKAKVYYSCQEHSETRFSKKGKCPKCGMKLRKYKIFSYE